ncbi:hypothetical protein CLU79DRAFT_727913 [Phycomyces nitens]|nr:hypothetical protein CLU79DRAFT_727913 [Phycomyces nitens]
MLNHPFQESFWSPNAAIDPVPNFSIGLNVLHQKLHQSVEENSVIVQYLRRRIAAEQGYANLLLALAPNDSLNSAFERDDGAGLKKSFEIVRSESGETAQGHLSRAANLTEAALDPLERLTGRYQRIVTTTKTTMDKRIASFELVAATVEQLRTVYVTKCRAVQAQDLDYIPPLPSSDLQIRLGKWAFTYREITRVLQQMHEDYRQEFNHSKDGQDLSLTGSYVYNWVHGYCARLIANENIGQGDSFDSERLDTEEKLIQLESMEICRDLLQQCFLYSVPTKRHVFDSSPDHLYRIHRQPLSGLKGSTPIRKYDPAKPVYDESKPSPPGAFGGIFERWNNKHHEEYRQTAIQDMLEADKAYKEVVRKAEHMRMETEQILFMHYEEMESLELERIQTIKQAFISIAASLSNTIPLCKEMYDRMMLYQETLRPDQDVRFIVEQYRTGRYCPCPIVYQNHFHGPASGQVFGIPLEELARARQLIVPPLISQGLVVIESGFTKLYDEEKNKAWTTQLPLDRVHAAREEVNYSPVAMSPDYLERYDVLLLASLIRLFLMELPECLLTFELYEPFKLIYTNWTQDDESRLISISKLLATLPTTNYCTLRALMNHFHKLFEDAEEEHSIDLLDNLATTFGHILIRPQIETTLRINDKHPQRLLRDLIKNFEDIFPAEAHKTQIDNSNKRPGITNSDSSSKEPSLDAPSFSSTLSSTASGPNSLATTATTNQNSSDSDGSPPPLNSLKNTDLKPSSSTIPTRRRTLLSFMRRSGSSEPIPQEQNVFVIPKNDGSSLSGPGIRKPIHVPSASMLFEDPEDTPSSPLPLSPTYPPSVSNISTQKRDSMPLIQMDEVLSPIQKTNAQKDSQLLGKHLQHKSFFAYTFTI